MSNIDIWPIQHEAIGEVSLSNQNELWAVQGGDVVGVKSALRAYHHTDAAGANGISESGKMLADAKGRVFLTDQKLTPNQVRERLFVENAGEKGSHVVEVILRQGADVRPGKNARRYVCGSHKAR